MKFRFHIIDNKYLGPLSFKIIIVMDGRPKKDGFHLFHKNSKLSIPLNMDIVHFVNCKNY